MGGIENMKEINFYEAYKQRKECSKTFSSITGSLLSYTKKQPYQWFEYIQSLFNGDTLARSADIAGISEPTSLLWRHKILSVLADLTHDNPVLRYGLFG